MKRRKNAFLVWIGAVTLFFGWIVPTASSQVQTVPLYGMFDGAGTLFEGNATHLGRFEGVIDSMASPPNAVWTAANGDTLTNITTEFEIDFSNPVSQTVFPYTQTIVFTDGSGRFQNATGSATIVGTIDIVTFVYDGRIEGTLSRPNSN